MRFANVRPGSAVSRVLLNLFTPGAANPGAVRPDTLQRAVRRAIRRGLVRRAPECRLTAAGRWYCIALRLGVSMSELAALAGIYAQVMSWGREPALARSGALPFAIRDRGAFAPGAYRAAAVRDAYNRLVMKGLVRRGGRGTVVLPERIRDRLEPYAEDLLALRAASGGGRVA